MNHRIAMCKLLQRTCLALNYNSAEHTNALAWRCNADAMTTSMTTEWQTSKRFYSKFTATTHLSSAGLVTAPPLCEESAYKLVLALNDSERSALKTALNKYDAMKLKEGFEGRLAATQWRSRFGRLTKVPPLTNVDPTGSFCTFPENWLEKRAEEHQIAPSKADLYKIFFVNAVPFVVFGFLDNFVMIMAGDYIETIFGTFMFLSTIAAAGLGNTVSDVIGIGTAFYVERFCSLLGLRPPDLRPIQMEMRQTRRAANVGRILGITCGCLLGMFPLLFLDNEFSTSTKEHGRKDENEKKEVDSSH